VAARASGAARRAARGGPILGLESGRTGLAKSAVAGVRPTW
jgi:hypothetical protein